MSTALDLIGSIIIASLVILMGLQLNMTIANTATTASVDRDNQESLVNTVRVFEYDFRKIGYSLSGQSLAITVADSNHLRFRTDLEGDGIIDSVDWYVGTRSLSASNQAKMLYRRENGKPAVSFGYGMLKFTYRKEGGGVATTLSEIESIDISLKQVSQFKVQDDILKYEKMDNPEVFWRQTRPVNQTMKRRI